MALRERKPEVLRKNILLVGKDEHFVSEVAHMLLEIGHRVHSKAAYGDAIEQFDREKFDMVITEVDLGSRNGYEFLNHVRESLNITPVLCKWSFVMQIVSFHFYLHVYDFVISFIIEIQKEGEKCGLMEDCKKAFSGGAADFLLKPLSEAVVTLLWKYIVLLEMKANTICQIPIEQVKEREFKSPAQLKVLINSNDDVSTSQLTPMLDSFQYQVEVVNSSFAVIEWLDKNNCDILLCDEEAAGLDGHKLIDRLRLNKRRTAFPVILMCFKDDGDNIGITKDCFEHGAADVLLKPISRQVIQILWKYVMLWNSTNKKPKPSVTISLKRKEPEAEAGGDSTWTEDLLTKFEGAMESLGGPLAATPMRILELMAGVTKDNIQRQLQKRRKMLPQLGETSSSKDLPGSIQFEKYKEPTKAEVDEAVAVVMAAVGQQGAYDFVKGIRYFDYQDATETEADAGETARDAIVKKKGDDDQDQNL